MTNGRRWRLLRLAAALALVALALIVWSVVAPSPLSVMVAMSLGQALGTASFGAYVSVVVADLFLGPSSDEEDR